MHGADARGSKLHGGALAHSHMVPLCSRQRCGRCGARVDRTAHGTRQRPRRTRTRMNELLLIQAVTATRTPVMMDRRAAADIGHCAIRSDRATPERHRHRPSASHIPYIHYMHYVKPVNERVFGRKKREQGRLHFYLRQTRVKSERPGLAQRRSSSAPSVVWSAPQLRADSLCMAKAASRADLTHREYYEYGTAHDRSRRARPP